MPARVDGEIGWLLLRQLHLNGWRVAVTVAFGGEGSMVIARKEHLPEISSAEQPFAAAALDVFERATYLSRLERALQLQLPGLADDSAGISVADGVGGAGAGDAGEQRERGVAADDVGVGEEAERADRGDRDDRA
jgi:hypothetical protein